MKKLLTVCLLAFLFVFPNYGQQVPASGISDTLPVAVVEDEPSGEFSLRTNALYWLAATPNIGIEWKPSDNFGILLNALGSFWSWGNEGNRYHSWAISPEFRWYPDENSPWFVGAEFHLGWADFKNGEHGRRGNLVGGGLIGGYRLYLSPMFDLDFSLGLGATKFHYDIYKWEDGVENPQGTNPNKVLVSPTQIGVSFIWKLR